MLTDAQVARAIAQNAADAAATALAPQLRDLFGVPPGEGFTPDLARLVAEYQRSTGKLLPDGIVGEKTRDLLMKQGYMNGDLCASLWPDGAADAAAQHSHYLAFCQRVDGGLPTARPLLFGLRGVYAFGRRTHRMIHAPRYDDAFVLLRSGRSPEVFRGATHAYQLGSQLAPDVDGVGGGDVGSIRPGRYVLTLLDRTPPEFELRTAAGSRKIQIPAFRDTDHDGVISAEEAERSSSATAGLQVEAGVGMFATEVLFHPGYDAIKPSTGRPFSSIACQTARLAELERLRDAGPEIDYVLANAFELGRDPSGEPPGNVA